MNTEWLDQLTYCNIHAIKSKSKNIMNYTGNPSVCVSPMWPNTWILTTVTRDNYWTLVTVIVCDSSFYTCISLKSLWFDLWYRYHLFCFWNNINLFGDMAMLSLSMLSCMCYMYPLITCMKCRYSYSAKIFFQSIAPPTKHGRAWFIQIDWWLHI